MTDIVIKEPCKVIADIIKTEMELDSSQIILENQKFNINELKGLLIIVSYVGGRAIGNNNYFKYEAYGVGTEIQQVAMNHLVQIDVMSYDSSARTRKEEILMALRSIYSQQEQDKNGMSIARIPSDFNNASMLEETGRLNRYVMSLNIKSIYTKTKEVDYYDNFQKEEVIIND